MARRTTKGTRQLAAEIAEGIADEVKRFAKGRGETLRQVLEVALRRHMANPPPLPAPPELPPLPPVPGGSPVKPAPKKTARRKKT